MKKIYCRPQIKSCYLMSERLMTTDSNGLKRQFKSRDSFSFDDEEEEDVSSSVWFSDN